MHQSNIDGNCPITAHSLLPPGSAIDETSDRKASRDACCTAQSIQPYTGESFRHVPENFGGTPANRVCGRLAMNLPPGPCSTDHDPRRREAADLDRDLRTRQDIRTARIRRPPSERHPPPSRCRRHCAYRPAPVTGDPEEALVVVNNTQATSQHLFSIAVVGPSHVAGSRNERSPTGTGEAPARAAVRADTQWGFLPTGTADGRRP
jgi:hypothetical protein